MLKNTFIYAIVPDDHYHALQVKSYPINHLAISTQHDAGNI